MKEPEKIILLVISVKSCQRCGLDHEKLSFKKLRNPADEFTWWAMCYVTDQPLLLAIKDT